jgi:hypothetical protein
MSDPFDVLRDRADGAPAPDLSAIRTRARRIERRHRLAVSSGAVAVVLVAVIGVVFRTGVDDDRRTLAEKAAEIATPSAVSDSSSAVAGATLATPTPKAAARAVGGSQAATAPEQDEHAAKSETTSGSVGLAAGSAQEPLNVTVSVRDLAAPHSVEFTLKACNETDGTVERDFGDAQRYDFEVTREGNVVWRWSDDRSFAEMLGTETWKAKSCKTWSETWSGTTSEGGIAPTGEYQVTGKLTSSPPQTSAKKTFCLDFC